MQITMGKKYTYKNGQPARILCVDGPNTKFPVISMDIGGLIHHHAANGSNEWTTLNLIEVWQPQDKEPVWAWNHGADYGRIIRFYDAENKCLFSGDGIRNGLAYPNYAKVEHYEQWMLDAQAKLQD